MEMFFLRNNYKKLEKENPKTLLDIIWKNLEVELISHPTHLTKNKKMWKPFEKIMKLNELVI